MREDCGDGVKTGSGQEEGDEMQGGGTEGRVLSVCSTRVCCLRTLHDCVRCVFPWTARGWRCPWRRDGESLSTGHVGWKHGEDCTLTLSFTLFAGVEFVPRPLSERRESSSRSTTPVLLSTCESPASPSPPPRCSRGLPTATPTRRSVMRSPSSLPSVSATRLPDSRPT
jgi:hypothetical protein